jgi:tetratricopeptide (TPR) repeat protein
MAGNKPPKTTTTKPNGSRQPGEGKGVIEQARRTKGSNKPVAGSSKPSDKPPTTPENATRLNVKVASTGEKPPADKQSKIVSAAKTALEKNGGPKRNSAHHRAGAAFALSPVAAISIATMADDKNANFSEREREILRKALANKPITADDKAVLESMLGRELNPDWKSNAAAKAAISEILADAGNQPDEATQLDSRQSIGSTVVNILSGLGASSGGFPGGLATLGRSLDMFGIQVVPSDIEEVESTGAVPSDVVVQVPQAMGPVESTVAGAPVSSTGASYLNPAVPAQPGAIDPQEITPDSLLPSVGPEPSNVALELVPAADDFLEQGQSAFVARDYARAEKAWRHAVVDDSENGTIWLLHAQSLFAIGDYERAAGAVLRGLLLIDDEDWGVVD